MKKFLSIVVIFIMFLCTACSKSQQGPNISTLDEIIKRDQLIVGVKTDAYPFGYLTQQKTYAGFDVELAKIIAKGILGSPNKVKFVPVTSSDRMMKLYSNEVDMLIATMSVTPKRKEIVDFSTSYHITGQSILVRKNSDIKSLKNLKNKKAIIVLGSTSERSLRSVVPDVTVIGYKTYKEAYKALKANKADAIISDNSILLGFALKDPSVTLLPKKFTKEPYAVAFRKEEASTQLLQTVDNILEISSRNGSIKNLKKTFGIN